MQISLLFKPENEYYIDKGPFTYDVWAFKAIMTHLACFQKNSAYIFIRHHH